MKVQNENGAVLPPVKQETFCFLVEQMQEFKAKMWNKR